VTAGSVVGVLLAAGEGRRLGRPKALVEDRDGRTWLERSVSALRDGGVTDVYVVVGAEHAAVSAAMPDGCRVLRATNWAEGMGASLRTGLAAVSKQREGAEAVIVMLVDTPGVGPEVVRRLASTSGPDVLARAAYGSEPGHPVLIGRHHWAGVLEVASGDRGARDYLRAHPVTMVQCADIGTGDDVDTAQALAAREHRGRPSHPQRPGA
jgi:CTP:molybdopterin cytidylyltransferase MocA